MKLLILSLLLGVFPCLYAVNNLRLPDMRSMGMGECAVTQSYLFNPALIGLSSYQSIDINYFNRYGLKELVNWNYRDDCVMLMLCLRIACIHVLSVKAIPEPSLESSVFARYFFALHI